MSLSSPAKPRGDNTTGAFAAFASLGLAVQ